MAATKKASAPPLGHVKVLELSRVLAGPWAAQCLADMGAEVLKVERPGRGDDTRQWGPPYLRDNSGNNTAESAYYLSANRSKRSVTLNFRDEEDRKTLLSLAENADVLIENFRPGTLTKYALDYESLRKRNPRLIYCSITGFGQTGPLKDRPGYDYMIQAMGGLMSITGEADERGGEPMRVGIPIADLMTGMYAAQAILGALLARDNPRHPQHGKGQHIDIALFDCQLSMLANQAMNALVSGQAPGRIGNAHPTIVPYQLFQTADRPIIVAVGTDTQFAALCDVLDAAELADDPRFATNPERVSHRATLLPLLKECFRRFPAAEWLQKLESANIPCSPILNVLQALHHPQAAARGMVVGAMHPSEAPLLLLKSPIGYSDTPLPDPAAPPVLGTSEPNFSNKTKY